MCRDKNATIKHNLRRPAGDLALARSLGSSALLDLIPTNPLAFFFRDLTAARMKLAKEAGVEASEYRMEPAEVGETEPLGAGEEPSEAFLLGASLRTLLIR